MGVRRLVLMAPYDIRQKHVTLERAASNSFLGTKLGILGHQFYAQIWTKIRSMLHARENARATLHPNKDILKLKNPISEPQLRFKVMSFFIRLIITLSHASFL